LTRIADLITRYGYAAIFCLLMLGIVGPLIPDETILVFAGILVREHRLDYAGVLVAAYAGSLCGITTSYLVGRKGLLYLFEKLPHFRKHSARYMEKVQTWFARYGRWTLFFGYFVVGVRHFTAVVAGASRMRIRYFVLYAYAGGLIWVFSFVSLGYFLGDQWERIGKNVNRGVGLTALVLATGVGIWMWRKQQRYR
jgi:membrane protein DedA with SNARE-associated domain